MEDSYKALVEAIIMQAIEDYQDLVFRGVASYTPREGGKYTKNEITRFLKSDQCSVMLKAIGVYGVTGSFLADSLAERENTIHNKKRDKHIAAFKEDGTLVKLFRNLAEATEFANLKNKANISFCCSGSRKTAGGYMWKYIR